MNQRHELGELIASVQAKNGWSDRDLERRADKLELRSSKSNFSRLKNQPLISVKGSLIKDLSVLLSVSEKTVADAALASMGVSIDRDSVSLEDAVRSEPNLSERDQHIALGVVELLKRDEGQEHGDTTGNVIPISRDDPAPGEELEARLPRLAAKKGRNLGKEQREQANKIGEENQDE